MMVTGLQWSQVAGGMSRFHEMLHPVFEEAFEDLLIAWRSHEVQRNAPDRTVQRLARSRLKLDRARDRAYRLRFGMYPEVAEEKEVAFVIFCPSLDAVVHIKHRGLERVGLFVRFLCPCGQSMQRPAAVEQAG